MDAGITSIEHGIFLTEPIARKMAKEGIALVATLAYHDLLDLPLSAVECWRYLLRPRFSSAAEVLRTPTLEAIEGALMGLVGAGTIDTRRGFYFFPGRSLLTDERQIRHARSQEKWKRLRRSTKGLQAIPFLRGIAVTGSLAFENAREGSDLDVLIIAAPNRVWTVRFLLTVLLDVFGLRRRPHGPTRDRVCLNHYLALDALEFPYRSMYTAMEYARLIPMFGEETCRRFRSANRAWMLTYLVQVFPDTLRHRKTLRPSPVLRGIQRAAELLLGGPIGTAVERFLARLQHARIARSEAEIAPQRQADFQEHPRPRGRVVATETRAEFHPHSREAPLLAAFNRRMEEFGLSEMFGGQRDSGLT